MGAIGRRWGHVPPWASVLALVLLTGGAATASALATSGPQQDHRHRATLTAPAPSPGSPSTESSSSNGTPLPTVTTTSSGSSKGNGSPLPTVTTTSTGSSKGNGSPLPTVTTTTAGALPSCESSQFSLVLTTGQSTYVVGQVVPMTLMITNEGPACMGFPEGAGYTCVGNSCGGLHGCDDEGVSISNSSGDDIWDSWGYPGETSEAWSCPAMTAEPIPNSWSGSSQFSWNEDHCPAAPPMTDNVECTQDQVATGTYEISATWSMIFGSRGNQANPVQITITPA